MTALATSRRLMMAALLALPLAAQADSPSRVIAAGGSVAEIVYALGAGDRLIARDTTSSFPPEVTALPDVGYVRALSSENLIAMEPDLILTEHDAGPPEVIEMLRRSGIPLVSVPQALDPDGVIAKIETVATALGLPDAGAALSAQVKDSLAKAQEAGANLPQSPRVLFILSMQGGRLMVAGADTSAAAMIALAGGTNALPQITGYKPVTDEAVIAAAPDVILMMDRGGDHEITLRDIQTHAALALTPAGAQSRVITMDGLFLLGFGPRTGEAALHLTAELHRTLTGDRDG